MSFNNAQDLFIKAFGIAPIVYQVNEDERETPNFDYGNIPTKPLEEAKELSWLGTPIIFPIVFKGGVYKVYGVNGKIEELHLEDFKLPPTTIVDFRRQKLMTKTPILGLNGTVKEVYGHEDWNIRFRGLCLNTPTQTAHEELAKLLNFEPLISGVEVIGQLFKDKGIYNVSIEEIDIRTLEGRPDVIPFEITACSDVPILLEDY